ncbi:hypothetical protein PG985_005721 [Apiospora marii]|uniref:uncharacterized protein n=1 Tax=Apiospora marii TaxID=335849 RepID=UPI00312E530F
MRQRNRLNETFSQDKLAEQFLEFEKFAAAPSSDMREVSARMKAARERVMGKWNSIWLELCDDADEAKKHCKIFLLWHRQNSGRWEICLGPDEHKWKREVTYAVTLAEVWKYLVVKADNTVLHRKRKQDRANQKHWRLAFAEKDKTGPIAEISGFIAGALATKCNLSLEQTFVKQQTTPEDITLFLDTL